MPRKIIIELVKWQKGQPSNEEFSLVEECELQRGIEAAVAEVFSGTVIASDPEWALLVVKHNEQIHIKYERQP